MRIPFIERVDDIEELGVEPGLWDYISDSRGGSAFLFAGAVFWFLVAGVAAIGDDHWVAFVLYGGLLVPVLATLIARMQRARLLSNVRYASLAGFAAMTELAALPVMFFLRDSHPGALIAILMIADGAHLLIYMWLHFDYWYFLAANAKVVLGALFLFDFVDVGAPQIQAGASGAVSLAVAPLIWRDSQRTADLYRRR